MANNWKMTEDGSIIDTSMSSEIGQSYKVASGAKPDWRKYEL